MSNPAPVAADDNFVATEHQVLADNVMNDHGLGADIDPDGDAITVLSVNGNPANVGVATAGSTGGTFTIGTNGSLVFDPGNDFNSLGVGASRDTTTTYTLIDSQGQVDTATVTVTVQGTNDAPTATDDNLSTDEDTIASGNVVTSDNGNGIDLDPDGDPLRVSEIAGSSANVGLPVAGSSGGLFTIQADGSYVFDPSTDFQNLAIGATRSTSINYTITDDNGGVSSATVTIVVAGQNDAPIAIGTIPPQTTLDGTTIAPLDLSVFFDDVDDGSVLTFDDGSTLPPGLTMSYRRNCVRDAGRERICWRSLRGNDHGG